ncbi:MAG: cytochrome c-type biogenesis protein CcmH [Actinobacteria bacterium]|nr:cytochrome c-type biogenesis protein CcmH [Actinomycetota bacterium]
MTAQSHADAQADRAATPGRPTTAAAKGKRRRAIMLLLLVVAAGVAAAGLLRAVGGADDAGEAAQIEQIAASLRCPTCQGLSVADSPSQLADGMRDIITEQVAAGRSSDQIRGWFVDRYGPWILLSPPTRGPGAVAWVLPVAAIMLGVVVAWRRTRRGPPASATVRGVAGPRRLAWAATSAAFAVLLAGVLAANVAARADGDVLTGTANAPRGAGDAGPPPLDALRRATTDQPGDPQAWLALAVALDRQGDLDAALDPYQRALRLADDDPVVQTAAASALVRADRPGAAEPVLRDLAARFPDDPEILLLLGTAQRALGRFGATATLQRFLQVAPDHPAAGAVRALLDDETRP